ncbi:MAG TPA: TrmH family RNA methyltransferase [Patescibacteria group bacterium]|nr:TrmH family RNA methyltransferase [Patescibacteria group bacterium]
MRQLILIVHNVRSAHNVGSLLRTAEGLGLQEVILSGYTPYPATRNDERLPHIVQKLTKQIDKTALGSTTSLHWSHEPSIEQVISKLKHEDFFIAALEQAQGSMPLPKFQPPDCLAIVVGNEVEGLDPETMALCDQPIEIPMFGKKESFNVVQAAAMALYRCRFTS